MGLVAREIEGRGIPTLSMSSAWSITRAVNPPRAVYLDFPLGHTAGKPHEPDLNQKIMRATLDVFRNAARPGEIVRLPFEWTSDDAADAASDGDDAWKDGVMRPRAPGGDAADSRVERYDTPQYQCDDDRVRAEAAGECATCVFL